MVAFFIIFGQPQQPLATSLSALYNFKFIINDKSLTYRQEREKHKKNVGYIFATHTETCLVFTFQKQEHLQLAVIFLHFRYFWLYTLYLDHRLSLPYPHGLYCYANGGTLQNQANVRQQNL